MQSTKFYNNDTIRSDIIGLEKVVNRFLVPKKRKKLFTFAMNIQSPQMIPCSDKYIQQPFTTIIFVLQDIVERTLIAIQAGNIVVPGIMLHRMPYPCAWFGG